LVNGKRMTPLGRQISVGSFPFQLAMAPDGHTVVVSTIGNRQFLTAVDLNTRRTIGQIPFSGRSERLTGRTEGLYYGLAFAPGTSKVFVSRGEEDYVSAFNVSREGLVPAGEVNNPCENKSLRHGVAGLAFSGDGKTLYAANNQTYADTNFKGSLSVLDVATGQRRAKIDVGGFPYAVAAVTVGPQADRKVYVANERDANLSVVDVVDAKVSRTITVGARPISLRLDRAQQRLFVANADSDTISIINTKTDRVEKTILLRPHAMRGLPGASPLGLTLSPDESQVYIALADMNAVAVVDVAGGKLLGYLPTGWYPTDVAITSDGKRLAVACAKGVEARNPNGKPVGDRGQYILGIMEGTLSILDLPTELGRLRRHTEQVLINNLARADLTQRTHPDFKNPGIKHVIYVVKENRTYDQVLGDLPQGNGDPSLTIFGRDITPNQHALVERFALMDDFYVCADVSADGWNWSTSGMSSPYNQRNSITNYARRGRAYDFEGLNNGTAVDLRGIPDVNTAAGGYIWEHALKHGKEFLNFGLFSASGDKTQDKEMTEVEATNSPSRKSLVGRSDANFLRYDLAYADSDAWVKHGVSAPAQQKSFGNPGSPSRISAFRRTFEAKLKSGKVPPLMMLRLGNDHTWGTAAGRFSPRAMVSDNDYAVGQLVEMISQSPIWKETAIFILEDDAQNGFDHVDAHRSTGYVISPFVAQGTLYKSFANTDSMLRTMELILGLPPMNQYVAVAPPLLVFGDKPTNDRPYHAILPAKEIVCEVNKASAYRSADSLALIKRDREESVPDAILNDILWHNAKGANAAKPPMPYGLRLLGLKEADRK